MIQRREFWMILLLSIVTCGIYTYYYLYQITKDLNTMAGNDGKTVDPTIVVVLSIVTCGIYTVWWYYQMGNRIQQMGMSNNIPVEENGTTYLMWYLIGYLVCGLGSYVAMYLFIKNFNNIAFAYNSHISNGNPYQQNPSM
ncbi:DUF4234 domain-containing protein [Massiliimalia massiliensis]|uniref:DUF4234 domain-containing protein n=1 Tax=Massiliimalia massiliensis TaxID=1852384 RepID=UPI0009854F1F|nr:DUF4234 domain-containing protein [Massiliimalia massiliensis]